MYYSQVEICVLAIITALLNTMSIVRWNPFDVKPKSLTHFVVQRQQEQSAILFHLSRAVPTIIILRYILQVILIIEMADILARRPSSEPKILCRLQVLVMHDFYRAYIDIIK